MLCLISLILTCPQMEDDPGRCCGQGVHLAHRLVGLTAPELWVNRTLEHMLEAASYNCSGLLGLHSHCCLCSLSSNMQESTGAQGSPRLRLQPCPSTPGTQRWSHSTSGLTGHRQTSAMHANHVFSPAFNFCLGIKFCGHCTDLQRH
jgi:hypothetical protein